MYTVKAHIVFTILQGSLVHVFGAVLPNVDFTGDSIISQANIINADEQGEYFEGDMLFGPQSFSGLVDQRYRWPNREVLYKIDSAFTEAQKSVILAGINEIASKTCIRFKEQSTEEAYVFVERGASGTGCNSYVGRIGRKQRLNLQSTCVTLGVVAHEFIHAIGFRHEHSRTDRETYISINYDNIQPEYHYAFNKYGPETVESFGVEYDYGSIMHYSKNAFAKDYRQPTIITSQPGVEIGQRRGLSVKDIQKINKMYDC